MVTCKSVKSDLGTGNINIQVKVNKHRTHWNNCFCKKTQ